MNKERLSGIIDTARGEQPAGLLLLNARVVNVFTVSCKKNKNLFLIELIKSFHDTSDHC